jgi:N-acetylmuramoyl-L-alanine amidase
MLRKVTPIVLLATLATVGAARTQFLQMTAIRHFTMKEATRVILQVSGEFQYRSDRLHNPDRVYFDILHCSPSFKGKNHILYQVNDARLKRVRVAETEPGTSRVVFDMEENVDYKVEQLSNPDRLIVEFRAISGPIIPPPPLVTSDAKLPPPPMAPPAPAAAPPMTAVVATVPQPPPVSLADAAATAPVSPIKTAPIATTAKPSSSMSEAAKAAAHTSKGDNSLIRALGLKITRVVLDAGHGGHDQGTTGPHGLMEKELVLDVVQRLGKLIEERMGAEVIYTRTDDTFVPLEERTRFAMEKKADLFLSVHANSSPYPRAAGVETYYLNFTDSKEALDVAARENASSQKTVYELRDLIQKITLHEKIEESREFANKIQASLFAFAQHYSPSIRNRGVKKAPFVVLIGAQMPSVLTEIGFVTNSREEALLKRPEHRQKLAEALYRGIAKYAEGLSHFQVAKMDE